MPRRQSMITVPKELEPRNILARRFSSLVASKQWMLYTRHTSTGAGAFAHCTLNTICRTVGPLPRDQTRSTDGPSPDILPVRWRRA